MATRALCGSDRCHLLGRTAVAAAALALALAAPSYGQSGDAAASATILYNGRIFTAVEKGERWAEALIIRGNRIEAVGRSADLVAGGARGAKLVDLKGKMVVPGIIDGHAH